MDTFYTSVMVVSIIAILAGVGYAFYLFRELDKKELQSRIELETSRYEALQRSRTSK